MPLLDLPNELLQKIADFLPSEQNVNALARTSKKLYDRLNDYLYLRNLRQGGWALYWAFHECMPQTAKRMLELGADPNIPWISRREVRPLLNFAISTEQLELARVLLQNGADANGRDDLGETPLFAAARNGDVFAVNLLLEHGADRGIYDYGDPPPRPRWTRLERGAIKPSSICC